MMSSLGNIARPHLSKKRKRNKYSQGLRSSEQPMGEQGKLKTHSAFFFAVLWLELRAYTLSHSTSPFL
jgi:hypothetical protein